MNFLEAVFEQLSRDDFPALNQFCAERGIEEGGWLIEGDLVIYEDWTHGISYSLAEILQIPA